jgi:hypothetical protein
MSIGDVTFIDQNTAVCLLFIFHLRFLIVVQSSAGLLSINSAGNAIMRVETTPVVQATRQSVRIQTQRQINGGLITMEAVHMPHGCGVWP